MKQHKRFVYANPAYYEIGGSCLNFPNREFIMMDMSTGKESLDPNLMVVA